MDEPKGSQVFWGPVTVKEIKTVLSQKIPPEQIGRRKTICETQPTRTIYADSPTTNMLIERYYFGDPIEDVNVSFTSEYFTPNETTHNDKSDEAHCSTSPRNTDGEDLNTKGSEDIQNCSHICKDKSIINNTESKETLIDKISKVLDLSSCQTSVYASAGECSNCSNVNVINLNDDTDKNKSQFSDKEAPSVLILSDDDDFIDNNVEELENSDVESDNEIIVISDDDDDSFEVQNHIKNATCSLNNTDSKPVTNTNMHEAFRYSKLPISKQCNHDKSADLRCSTKFQQHFTHDEPNCSSFIEEPNSNGSNNATSNISCNPGKESTEFKLDSSYFSTEESVSNLNVNFSEILPHSFYEHGNYHRESNKSDSALFQEKLNNSEISQNRMDNCTDESNGNGNNSKINTSNQNETSIDLKLNFTELLQGSMDEHINNSTANISSEEYVMELSNSEGNNVNEKSYYDNCKDLSSSEIDSKLLKNSNEEDLDASQNSVNEEPVCLTPVRVQLNDNSIINTSVNQSHYANQDASPAISENSKLEWNDTIEEIERILQAEELNSFDYNGSKFLSHTGNNIVDNSLHSNSASNGTKPKKSLIPVKNAAQSLKPPKTTKSGNFKIPTRIAVANKQAYETVLSPIAVYIKNSPKAPLLQRIPSKVIPKSHLFPSAAPVKIGNKENEFELPLRVYKPAKHTVMSEQQQLKLPANIQRHIPHIPDIIRHQGRAGDKKSNQNITEKRLLKEDLTFCGNDTTLSTSSIDGDISLLVSKKAFIK